VRDKDQILLENAYTQILINENVDDEYLRLAQDPEKNEELLNNIVKEKAKTMGYKNHLYHGTFAKDFNVFRPWSHFGGEKKAAYDRLEDIQTHHTTREKVKNKTSKILKLYGKIKNPIKISADMPIWDEAETVSNILFDFGYISEEEEAKFHYHFDDFGNSKKGKSFKELQFLMLSKGFDAIVYKNFYENKNKNSYIIFLPSQIKSADPITYNDKKNIIPLSQRFDSSKDDIRY